MRFWTLTRARKISSSLALCCVVAASVALLAGAFGTPVVSVCDATCHGTAELEQRAAGGDIAAIKLLLVQSKEARDDIAVERHLLEGAFAGDLELQREFFRRWQGLAQSHREALLHALQRTQSGPVAACYLRKLESLTEGDDCSAEPSPFEEPEKRGAEGG